MGNANLTTEQRIDLISQLELRDDYENIKEMINNNELVQKTAEAGKESGNIDDGSIMSFTAGVSSSHTSAALNSALLAQLNSDKLFNRFDQKQLMDWYKNYQKVLGICGWTLQDFQFQNYQASGSTFSINEAIIGIVSAFLTAPELAIVKASLEALSKLSDDDPWYKVWDTSSHNTNGGNFQVGSAYDNEGQRNTLACKISAYSFSTTESTTRFLWEEYHASDTYLHFASQTMTLDEDIYDQVKDSIVKKLGDKAKQDINDLDI